MKTPLAKKGFLIVLAAAAAIWLLGYGGHRYWELNEWLKALEAQNAGLAQSLEHSKMEIARFQDNLSQSEKNNSDLTESLAAEKTRNDSFEAQIRDLSGAVGTLQKLSATDQELLRKYSKVYFLSENYVPAQLSAVGSDYLYDKKKPQLILSGALPYLAAMLQSAKRDGVTLLVVSAYRSFYEQADLKYGYKMVYGSGANQFSADQGYSEHQLGTACDFTTPAVGATFSKFEGSDAYKWLGANAHKFGFALSYPKNNSYYQFEPWHWRFVGTALAMKLHDTNEYFYNLPQRDLDQYLVSFFD